MDIEGSTLEAELEHKCTGRLGRGEGVDYICFDSCAAARYRRT
jgi:hypothetical protein